MLSLVVAVYRAGVCSNVLVHLYFGCLSAFGDDRAYCSLKTAPAAAAVFTFSGGKLGISGADNPAGGGACDPLVEIYHVRINPSRGTTASDHLQ
jgi:hypothetical protein